MKKIVIIWLLTNLFPIFAMEEQSTAMETGGQPKRKLSELSEKPEQEKEKEHISQCPIPRKRRKKEPGAIKVLPLREIAKQKFIEVVPEVKNFHTVLESILAEELKEEIKAHSQQRLSYEETRLHNARSKLEVKNFLILGVDPNVKDRDGRTALNALINNGNLDAAFHLIALKGKDLDVSSPDEHGVTPLQRAIKRRDLELATFILEILKEQSKIDSVDSLAVFISTIRYFPQFIKTLGQFGIDLKALNPDSKYKLMIAAAQYNANSIPLLIAAGVNVNDKSNDGVTPLMMAAASNPQGVTVLLDNGADVNAQDKWGNTAVMHAIRKNNLKALQLLIDAHADITIENKLTLTPLSLAALYNPNAIEPLIKAGANPNIPNKVGLLPLYQAIIAGSLEGVKKLLEFNANSNSSRKLFGKIITDLETAIAANKPDIVKLLLDAGAQVTSNDVESANNKPEIQKLLKEYSEKLFNQQ